MIPKVIHYVWFGENNLSTLEKKCLNSWKTLNPHYEIKQHSSYELINDCDFAVQAYQQKKWAFVSDYARLKILYEQGGIYLDTDMLAIKSFDSLLKNNIFFGYQSAKLINGAIIGAKPKSKFLFEILEFYRSIDFDLEKYLLIPKVLTYYYKWSTKDIKSNITLYPIDIFYPLPFLNKNEDYSPYIKPNTIAVHLWNHSWKDSISEKKLNKYSIKSKAKLAISLLKKSIYRIISILVANFWQYAIISL